MIGFLAYFCMACVVLFFRRLCSEYPGINKYNHEGENWWVVTAFLLVGWPLFAPLAGAYHLGKSARDSIE